MYFLRHLHEDYDDVCLMKYDDWYLMNALIVFTEAL